MMWVVAAALQLDLLESRTAANGQQGSDGAGHIVRSGSSSPIRFPTLTPVKEDAEMEAQLSHLSVTVATAASKDELSAVDRRLNGAIDRTRNEIEAKFLSFDFSASKPAAPAVDTVMTVTCPDDIGAGDSLVVASPDGDEVEVVVPDGIEAGMTFDVSVPNHAVAGESDPGGQVWNCARHCAAFESRLLALERSTSKQSQAEPWAELESLRSSMRKVRVAIHDVQPSPIAACCGAPGSWGGAQVESTVSDLENLQFEAEENSGVYPSPSQPFQSQHA